MKSIRKAIRRALKLVFRLGEVLLVIAAAGIVYFFCLFLKGPHEYDVLQKDAIAGIQKAEEAAAPGEQLEALHYAVGTYIRCTDMDKDAAVQEALNLLPRMQQIQQQHRLVPGRPESYLRSLVQPDRLEALSAFIHSGLFDFSEKAGNKGRDTSARLLCDMLEIMAAERHGASTDALKPLVLHLLQQGVRPTWCDETTTPDDPVLVAVYTRDAAFLRAVLATGCPARGTHGDARPEAEARWQNSPDLVEILQSY